MFKKNNIDNLVKKQGQLEFIKTKIRDNQNERNSNIENKMQKLQNVAMRNKEKADNKIADIERQIEKNSKLINIEVDYTKSIGLKFENKKIQK